MNIGLDIMGGDYAPEAIVLGAVEAHKLYGGNVHITLIGDASAAQEILSGLPFPKSNFTIVHAPTVIGMAEHPTKAIAQKPDSSIATGFSLLKAGQIDAFISAGNSGAMLVGAVFSVKPVAGILRPCLCALVPKLNGGTGLLVDVGANADCKPDVLVQFGVLGSLYAKTVMNIPEPKVALMNIGEEPEKGNMLAMASYPLMAVQPDFNFVGNVEGRDLFNDKADVIVCDGYTGNIILKMAESFHNIAVDNNCGSSDFFTRLDYQKTGGSPILGVNAPVIIGHGISSPEAIRNMVLQAKNMVESNLVDRIKEALN